MVICGNGNFSENRYLYAYVIKKCSLWTLRFPNVDGGMRGHGEKPQIIVKLAVGRPDSGRKNMKKIGNQDTSEMRFTLTLLLYISSRRFELS